VDVKTILRGLELRAAAFDLRDRAEHARAAGAIIVAEAAGWVAELEAAGRSGQFFSALTFFVVSGRKPA
jgi:hypothetical protein